MDKKPGLFKSFRFFYGRWRRKRGMSMGGTSTSPTQELITPEHPAVDLPLRDPDKQPKNVDEAKLEIFFSDLILKMNTRQIEFMSLKPAMLEMLSLMIETILKGREEKADQIFATLITSVERETDNEGFLGLLYILSLAVSKGHMSYNEGLEILSKKENKDRISRSSTSYVVKAFIDLAGLPQQPSTEFGMFIAECALISEDTPSASKSMHILSLLGPPNETEPWLNLICRLSDFLEKNDELDFKSKEFAQRAISRYRQEVPEDDF